MIMTKLNNTALPPLNSGGPCSNYRLKFCLSVVLRLDVWGFSKRLQIIIVFLEFKVTTMVAVNYSIFRVVTPLICHKFVNVSKKRNLCFLILSV
jgi:hypothetical protein